LKFIKKIGHNSISGMFEADYKKNFKDSCGFGLIVNLDNESSHWLVKTAIESLARLSHRGAIAADGKSGDGCGLLFKLPREFFRSLAQEAGIKLPESFAVASVFLSQDLARSKHALDVFERELNAVQLELLWIREVPVNQSACGLDALKTIPAIKQIFISPKLSQMDLERSLYVARRKTELALQEDRDFYFASCSSKLISYKGMLLPNYLMEFYPDLTDERFQSSLALFHQRFSTNTFPEWRLAQPFRLLAHNGEINTIEGNRNWSISREAKYESPLLPNLQELMPFVMPNGSDSMSLDNMLEGLVMTGVDFIHAIRILIPPAWQNDEQMDPNLKAMYEYYSLHMDPWDGPAGLVLTDGRYAACSMDRNGLRPARYVLTKDRHFTMASEIGVYDYAPEDVIAKGKLLPGELLSVDTETGKILMPEDINLQLAQKAPYKQWLDEYTRYLETNLEEEIPGCDPFFDNELTIYEKQFDLSLEEREYVLKACAEKSQEAVYSMGDDVPLAVLSKKPRSIYDYFRQQFAQVTNPPIDPIREKHVMSLRTCLGKEVNPFIEKPENAIRIDIGSPILSRSMFKALLLPDDPNFNYETIDMTYRSDRHIRRALKRICDQAENAVRKGKIFLILTDRRIKHNRVPIPALMAVGAIHARLNEKGLRCDCNLIVETATARDPHHFAALIGFGATAIYPYLAYQVLYDMVHKKHIIQQDTVALMEQYRSGIEKGLLKILSKMGISTINSYRGAQLFEALGLDEELIHWCFPGTVSRIAGAGFDEIEAEQRYLTDLAWNSNVSKSVGGLIKAFPQEDAEYHANNPILVNLLHQAVRENNYQIYKQFAKQVNERPATSLRDLLGLKPNSRAVTIDSVEPVEKILPRFSTGAMSLGAISPEAHEALAIAMNRIGAKSNSGEGGEDATRFGTESNSKIKQVASGRFGVTPEYLMSAEEIQIKIAQGAKPGEGGQLPGFKVNELIARLRHTSPGQTLISPPPHHDIYSIEDLAQLIFDLKQINPRALISVKLVSEHGVGTVAAGVAKTYADSITIAGHDGGTGASPLSSLRYAGVPWELGLVEAHRTLKANNLRQRVRVQIDGGLKTGLDVVKAAILGAELFGFGTISLVTIGCKFLRICHLNNCATGIATQNPTLRKDFKGLPEHTVNYFTFVANEVREWLAYLGVSSLDEIIGKTEYLALLPAKTKKQSKLSLDWIINLPDDLKHGADFCQWEQNHPFDKNLLAVKIFDDSKTAIQKASALNLAYPIKNISRSIGANVSGLIASLYGADVPDSLNLNIKLEGTAGQSFGVWNSNGVNLILEGDANDYVGKGMAGGKIVIKPPAVSKFESQNTAIAGNTCLYGATGGKFFAAGIAGERFAVRNSGAIAVLEGLGDHACEYMTGGVVVILGKTGSNIGAGMTGGMIFVYDYEQDPIAFSKKINPELVESINLKANPLEDYTSYLKNLIQEHILETSSIWAQTLLDDFTNRIKDFYLVKPKSANLKVIYDYKQQPVYRSSTH
jgi:glutamate synthase (NADPH/NADH) large chain